MIRQTQSVMHRRLTPINLVTVADCLAGTPATPVHRSASPQARQPTPATQATPERCLLVSPSGRGVALKPGWVGVMAQTCSRSVSGSAKPAAGWGRRRAQEGAPLAPFVEGDVDTASAGNGETVVVVMLSARLWSVRSHCWASLVTVPPGFRVRLSAPSGARCLVRRRSTAGPLPVPVSRPVM